MVGRDQLVFALYDMTYCFLVQIYQNSFARLLVCTGLYNILCWCCRQSPQNFNYRFWWNPLVYPPPLNPSHISETIRCSERMSQWNSSVNIQDRENNKKGLNYEIYDTKAKQSRKHVAPHIRRFSSGLIPPH